MPARLKEGSRLPEFRTRDVGGSEVSSANLLGHRAWILLTRFAACPFCSLRLSRLIDNRDRIKRASVRPLVIFPSSEDLVREFVTKHAVPFQCVSDPERGLFQLFGSETSWKGELRSAFRVDKVVNALASARMNPLAVDDAVHRMPSDFLVGPTGIVERAYYGERLDDGLRVREVVAWADSASGTP